MNTPQAPEFLKSPDFTSLCARLAAQSGALDISGDWPADQLRSLAGLGVLDWFFPSAWNGRGWSQSQICHGYLALSKVCMTTAFALTQWQGACSRILDSKNTALQHELVPKLRTANAFTTVGISHLTTSRRHLAKPALMAEQVAGGYRLSGYTPWVTGGDQADILVVGAALENGQQILVAADAHAKEVTAKTPARLMALTGSHTGEVTFDGLIVPADRLLAGPVENVLSQGTGAATGGLQTSTLALGLAQAAIEALAQEAALRPELQGPQQELARDHAQLLQMLFALAEGDTNHSNAELRTRANSLVLRATQAFLAAAKGLGYMQTHAASRWCKEAMFFLVWSCPAPVMQANLCELAGLA